MEKESSTNEVCNAIRMNEGLFNEEASFPLMLPLPIQLFHYSEWEVRAAGLQSWVYWRLRLTRSKHNHTISQNDIFIFGMILHHVKVIVYHIRPQLQPTSTALVNVYIFLPWVQVHLDKP